MRETVRCNTNSNVQGSAQRTIARRAKEQQLDMTVASNQQAVAEATLELQQEMAENCIMAAVQNDPEYNECQRRNVVDIMAACARENCLDKARSCAIGSCGMAALAELTAADEHRQVTP